MLGTLYKYMKKINLIILYFITKLTIVIAVFKYILSNQ